MVRAKREYWTDGPGKNAAQLFALYRAAKEWRPTVINAVVNSDDEFLVVQRNTWERNWVFIQGEIEDTDSDPVEAGIRELWEEAHVSEDMIADVIEYLGEGDIPYLSDGSRPHDTGYTHGGSYKCIGIRLKKGCDISLTPPPGHEVALLAYRWCSYDEAVKMLRTQPGVENVSEMSRRKCEQLLIPAMDAFFQYEKEKELLSKI